MAQMQAILDKARELGDLLARHQTTQRYEEAMRRFEADDQARRLLTDYDRHMRSMSEKEASGAAIEVQDKHKLAELQKAVTRNTLLRDVQVAQMDYLDLMRKVDEAVQDRAAPAGAQEAGGAGVTGGGEEPRTP